MATSSLISAAFFIFLLHLATSVSSISFNYGTLGDNLLSSLAVANFLDTKTTIDSVKIFDVSPQILQAFAGSGISVTITAPNGDIPALTNLGSACQWVVAHIKPFHPQTKINNILFGSKVLHWTDWNTIKLLIPAMRTLHRALNAEGIRDIKDLITVTSEITYDRESIEKLLFSGKNNSCPVTKPPLSVSDSSDLVPNRTLCRLIQSWCTINASLDADAYSSHHQNASNQNHQRRFSIFSLTSEIPPNTQIQMMQMSPLKPCDDPVAVVSTMMQMTFFCLLSASCHVCVFELVLFPQMQTLTELVS